jgi:arylsulfatase A-like enzyme
MSGTTRRILAGIAVLVLVPLAALHAATAAPGKRERPNILFFFADDWGRYAGCYAGLDGRPTVSDVVKTPNIDRIAREGVIFRNAFVNAPSCTPCRSALLSGQYFFRTGGGAILQGATWNPKIPVYPLMLRDAGYHIGKSYKVWRPGTPVDAPYGGQKYAYEKAGSEMCQFSENATRHVREGLTVEAAKEKIFDQVRDNFRAFLADRKQGSPFCYWFGPTNTHRPYAKGSGKALWDIDPDSVKGKLPKFMPDVPEVRADYADYLGETQAWDTSVGVILKELDATGEFDNTLIVISGDHGMPGVPGGKCNLYDHGVGVALIVRGPGIKGGRVVDDFVNMMDMAPTFLDAGGVKIPKTMMTAHSIMPVLRSDKSGLVDASRTWVVTGRERHVAAAREGNLPYPMRALRTKEFLYIRNFAADRWPMGSPKFSSEANLPSFSELEQNTFISFADMDASPTKAWVVRQFGVPQWQWHYNYAFDKRPAEELYDLAKDPDETKNLAANPAYAAQRKELGARLIKILTDAKDPRVVRSPAPYDHPPFVGDYDEEED